MWKFRVIESQSVKIKSTGEKNTKSQYVPTITTSMKCKHRVTIKTDNAISIHSHNKDGQCNFNTQSQ